MRPSTPAVSNESDIMRRCAAPCRPAGRTKACRGCRRKNKRHGWASRAALTARRQVPHPGHCLGFAPAQRSPFLPANRLGAAPSPHSGTDSQCQTCRCAVMATGRVCGPIGLLPLSIACPEVEEHPGIIPSIPLPPYSVLALAVRRRAATAHHGAPIAAAWDYNTLGSISTAVHRRRRRLGNLPLLKRCRCPRCRIRIVRRCSATARAACCCCRLGGCRCCSKRTECGAGGSRCSTKGPKPSTLLMWMWLLPARDEQTVQHLVSRSRSACSLHWAQSPQPAKPHIPPHVAHPNVPKPPPLLVAAAPKPPPNPAGAAAAGGWPKGVLPAAGWAGWPKGVLPDAGWPNGVLPKPVAGLWWPNTGLLPAVAPKAPPKPPCPGTAGWPNPPAADCGACPNAAWPKPPAAAGCAAWPKPPAAG